MQLAKVNSMCKYKYISKQTDSFKSLLNVLSIFLLLLNASTI